MYSVVGEHYYRELELEAMAPREELVGFWDTLTYLTCI
jgi:hypothetical protein